MTDLLGVSVPNISRVQHYSDLQSTQREDATKTNLIPFIHMEFLNHWVRHGENDDVGNDIGDGKP